MKAAPRRVHAAERGATLPALADPRRAEDPGSAAAALHPERSRAECTGSHCSGTLQQLSRTARGQPACRQHRLPRQRRVPARTPALERLMCIRTN